VLCGWLQNDAKNICNMISATSLVWDFWGRLFPFGVNEFSFFINRGEQDTTLLKTILSYSTKFYIRELCSLVDMSILQLEHLLALHIWQICWVWDGKWRGLKERNHCHLCRGVLWIANGRCSKQLSIESIGWVQIRNDWLSNFGGIFRE
jgi:hypothetical protein